MNVRSWRFARQILLSVSAVAFATKLLIPVGYMPSAIADGWPITLCDSGLHRAAPSEHHHHDDHDDSGSELQWKHCPLGALATAGAIPVEYHLDVRYAGLEAVPVPYVTRSIAAPVLGFRSRAPPPVPPSI